MPTLLSSQDLAKAYASHTLFSGVGLQLVDDDRLGIIGPNGAGKSTLLKILAGLETPDAGEITCRRGLRQVYVPQDDQFAPGATPMSVVAAQLADDDRGEQRMDAATRASIALSKLGFVDFEQPVENLSGGWRKRLSIACALVREPDVLLLDEPTNHLDLEGIVWLEKFMRQAAQAIVFVTHDRRFLEDVAIRIIELSSAYPGGTFEVAGNYTEFVRRKSEFLDGQSAAQAVLANTVRRDTAWLRQGIQARRTRNKTQVQDAGERRADLKAIKSRNDAPLRTTAIDFQATERKTKKLLALHSVAKSMGGKKLFEKLDLMLSPGRRIGLIGPNGSGKTTLLRLMSGELEPDSGTIKRAAGLRIITFTQHRAGLIPTQTLAEALAPTGDTVDYRGKLVHITGWAKKFLFSPNQLSTYVSNLSGGEQARILIARLMLEPADVLLLDEPTNDLDIPSLEVLEQALLEFPGAIMLITHDRFMLERISSEFLALDGQGRGATYASIRQWQQVTAKRQVEEAQRAAKASAHAEQSRPSLKPSASHSKKLSFMHQREFAGIEESILQAEAEVESMQADVADPAVIADHVRLAEACRRLDEAQRRVQMLYERWSELDAMQRASGDTLSR